jgi:4'-phosphopantetheinyl transferase EntD
MQQAKQHHVDWHKQMAAYLQTELYVAFCDNNSARFELSEQEYKQARGFVVDKRREDWLRGRKALKHVLAQLELSQDTSDIVFPHPRYSLSHSNGYALAVGTSKAVSGIGVDLELSQGPRVDAAHLFLTERELADWRQVDHAQQATVLRRLWCIKEAAYKSYQDNHVTGLFDYELEDIGALTGCISCKKETGVSIDYVCTELQIGQQLACVAVAVSH